MSVAVSLVYSISARTTTGNVRRTATTDWTRVAEATGEPVTERWVCLSPFSISWQKKGIFMVGRAKGITSRNRQGTPSRAGELERLGHNISRGLRQQHHFYPFQWASKPPFNGLSGTSRMGGLSLNGAGCLHASTGNDRPSLEGEYECMAQKELGNGSKWGSAGVGQAGTDLDTKTGEKKGQEPPEDGEVFTVEGAIERMGFARFQYLLLGYAGLAWMAEAMELMLLSFVGPAVRSQWTLTSQQESLISSAVFVGMLFGAYTWGVLSDVKGRKVGFATTAVLTFVASLLSALAPGYLWLLAFRFLVGVGLGGAPVVFSLFLEFVPARRRGFWMVIFSLFWTLGSVTEGGLAWAVMPWLGWRWLLGLSSAPLALLLLFYRLLPESPRFLVVKERPMEALAVLARVSRANAVPLPRGRLVANTRTPALQDQEGSAARGAEAHGLAGEGDAAEGGPRRAQEGAFSVLATLVAPPLLRSTALLWGVFFANAFTYYGLVLLTSELTGNSGHCAPPGEGASALVLSSAEGGINYRDVFIASIAEAPGVGVAALVVDRIGRKGTMALLLGATGLSLAPLLQPLDPASTTGALFVARACIMGAFQVLFLYAPEVYPTSTRSTGLGIANSFSRLGGILCPFIAVGLVQGCQQSLAVSLFVAIPVAAAIAVTFFPQETSGKGLKDSVDDELVDV